MGSGGSEYEPARHADRLRHQRRRCRGRSLWVFRPVQLLCVRWACGSLPLECRRHLIFAASGRVSGSVCGHLRRQNDCGRMDGALIFRHPAGAGGDCSRRERSTKRVDTRGRARVQEQVRVGWRVECREPAEPRDYGLAAVDRSHPPVEGDAKSRIDRSGLPEAEFDFGSGGDGGAG